ncbi:lipopolysaccharide biosynthesis protein [Halobaculum sp. CBA1158]|uniref:lipopolysaccharide biosynthesis protein n=1 Tax=Halobaculum sp. CBA1158 TaxID=2904243 RepID=UPI001F3C2BFE|nr:lipopolysaccharide biosynthesis protein [Halobaculum sp. CBA1158]UIO99151.1 lipopolysaccharide biosynthesis protein [Halobaculum sp. CBA1158]
MDCGEGPNDEDAAGDADSTATAPDTAGDGPTDPVDAELADALERVAHGAVVSTPSIVLQRGLTLAFTALLTNTFSAGPYGLFALARRIARFLRRLALGVAAGLSRFVPSADGAAERDAIATVAAALLAAVSLSFAAALFLAAPRVAAVAGEGSRFALFLRIFAAGLPASVALFGVARLLRATEEVTALNLLQRVAFPVAQLAVGVVGAVALADLTGVAVAVPLAMGAVAVGGAAWLARRRGIRPRIRVPGGDGDAIRRRYVRYTAPLFLSGFATTTQRLGFYPLIAVFLSGTAGGVFAVGVLVGSLVRLPLMAINQFIPPVAAALNDDGHPAALSRLYHVTSRLVLVGVVGLSVPAIVYREAVMSLFGPAFVAYAPLLPGFVLAQVLACAAGSVGILLRMTDHQRALLVVNTVITLFLAVTAIPLTIEFGLAGVVASYLLMLGVNNGLEVAVLYRVEGLQPFTLAHGKPLLAAVPFLALALATRELLPRLPGALAGTAVGLAAYVAVLRVLGVSPVERRLLASLAERYRAAAVRLRDRVGDGSE